MQPDEKDLLEAVQEALHNPRYGGTVSLPGGGEATIEREPEPGIRLRLTSGGRDGTVVTLYAGSTSRPGIYPSGLPFVPGEDATVVDSVDGRVAVNWWTHSDPISVMDRVERESLRTGWRPAGRPGSAEAFPGLRVVQLEKEGVQRTLMAGGTGQGDETGFVSMVDEPQR